MIIPGHIQHRRRVCAALLPIQIAQAHKQATENFAIVERFARRFGRRPVPLQPAARISDRTVLFGEAGGREAEDFGLDICRTHVVHFAVVLPEIRRLGHQRIDHHQIFKLRQRAGGFVFIRERRQRVKSLHHVAVDFALGHQLGLGHDIV